MGRKRSFWRDRVHALARGLACATAVKWEKIHQTYLIWALCGELDTVHMYLHKQLLTEELALPSQVVTFY